MDSAALKRILPPASLLPHPPPQASWLVASPLRKSMVREAHCTDAMEVRFSGSTTETSTMTILRYRNSVLLTMGTSWPESSILPTDNKNTTWHMGTHGPSLLSSHADDRFGTIQCCVWGLENARLLKYTVCVPKVKLSSKCASRSGTEQD